MELKMYQNRITMSQFQMLRLECGFEPLDSSMLKIALSNSIIKLTMEAGEKPVGMLRVVGDGAYVFIIADLLVHPKFRRQGIGSALVTRAVFLIKQMIPEDLWSNVALFSSRGKERFYKKLGFVEIPSGDIGSGMIKYIQGTGHYAF